MKYLLLESLRKHTNKVKFSSLLSLRITSGIVSVAKAS